MSGFLEEYAATVPEQQSFWLEFEDLAYLETLNLTFLAADLGRLCRWSTMEKGNLYGLLLAMGAALQR